MNRIHIKVLSEDALTYLKENVEVIAKKISKNENNDWVQMMMFPKPMFIEKKFEIDDFELVENPESTNKDVDFNNSVILYEKLNHLPNYILSDQRFWLWLHFEKFYKIVRTMMKINGTSTVEGHWMHKPGTRRGLMFGVLSRCYYRVALTIDEKAEDKYVLTKWIIDNPLRYRDLTWRTYSSISQLTRGILKGEKRAVDENPTLEKTDYYQVVAKYFNFVGSVRLLDMISEEDAEELAYNKMIELLLGGEEF